MGEISMDTWIRANDDALQAKELRAQFIEAAKGYAGLALLDPENSGGHVYRLDVAMRLTADRVDSFINWILDVRGSLSGTLMRIAVEKHREGSQGEFNNHQLIRVLDEFIGLVAAANPALSTVENKEVTP